jgi:hypothetical protein
MELANAGERLLSRKCVSCIISSIIVLMAIDKPGKRGLLDIDGKMLFLAQDQEKGMMANDRRRKGVLK